MKRKLAVSALLCAMVVTALALTLAPAASAKAVFTYDTGKETYALPPNLVAESITGKVAHLTFDNVLREESDSGNPLGTGLMSTHMNVVTFPVDGSWLARHQGDLLRQFPAGTRRRGRRLGGRLHRHDLDGGRDL